ncbi:probable 3-methyl-2-oxobutanoate dehydrogenase alpha chain precursor [Thermoplasma acidophilum]|uniref:Probable 3-methyl-2-oxobutanoate dehydrogenase alpha chain n=1 Tax=Thermoplasma acidophilum (strain ATCC 25905 / DSM 1728 / JCM 9062 / NBRC 15155 / AMRC-C165) TaxID=273075 RepID=Q9HIA3_THEAC|nr:thiamine pyrophosphate-dependent dehydrogenase E1 component subunit alpha [Thermoplasma acidophilum]CAC12558.1 probable 3-methyl-2-oxobutanoate dehydrogenase alpha chain precursor [Thermoplasma acidophilum]
MTEVLDQDEKNLIVRGFTSMVLGRYFDKKIITAQRQGLVGFYTPMMGQEATQAGAAMALSKEDSVYGYYRDVTMLIYLGHPIEKIFDQIMGNAEDSAKGRQMPSHYSAKEINFMSVPSPVATNLPLAVGAAYAKKYRKQEGIVITTFGDGGTSTPDFHAAMNFAAVFDLPVVFLCENNGWAISLPVEKQTKAEIYKKAEAYGMKGVYVDGNDFIKTYRTVKDAVEYARSGNPILVEARSYRMGPHSTSDDPSKYRKNEVQENSDLDPLVIAEKLMISGGYLNQAEIDKIKDESKKMIDEKFEERLKIPAPDPETMFDDVYSEITWAIEEERGEILRR